MKSFLLFLWLQLALVPTTFMHLLLFFSCLLFDHLVKPARFQNLRLFNHGFLLQFFGKSLAFCVDFVSLDTCCFCHCSHLLQANFKFLLRNFFGKLICFFIKISNFILLWRYCILGRRFLRFLDVRFLNLLNWL